MRLLGLFFLAAVVSGGAISAQENDPMKAWRDTGNEKPLYIVHAARTAPELSGIWNGDAWRQASTLRITKYFPSGDFRPQVQVRLLHTPEGVYVHFLVEDQYVLTTRTKYRGEVWKDSCAEFFVQPKPDRGYFNFEITSGGTMLASYHEHPEYQGEKNDGGIPWALARQIQLYHSAPKILAPETAEPLTWQLEYFLPFELLEHYVGPLERGKGEWRANFYKCAEDNSHPHWGAWAEVVEDLDFHQPRFFGVLRFE